MAKFCTQCGKKLEDGEICSCRQQAAPQAAPDAAPNAAPQATAGAERPVNPNMNQQFKQAGPNMNQQYQQAGPNMNQQYQQAGPNMNQQYQQGAPNMNQQYQQGAPYMNQQYRQSAPNMNQQIPPNMNPQQYQQYQQYQRRAPKVQGADVAAEAKNVLAKAWEMFKKPVTATRQFTNPNTLMGIELIGAKAVITVIIAILAVAALFGKIDDMTMGYASEYGLKAPYFQIIILCLIMTAGTDFLDALFLKLLASDRSMSFKSMTINVSTRVVYELAGIVLGGLCIWLGLLLEAYPLMIITVIVACAVALITPYAQFAAYFAIVKNNENGKVFRYILSKIILSVVSFIIMLAIGSSIISDIVQALEYL